LARHVRFYWVLAGRELVLLEWLAWADWCVKPACSG
jgi:hypothetical protein